MNDLLIRTITGIILAAVAILAVLYLPSPLFKVGIAVISAIAVWEATHLLQRKYHELNPTITAVIGFISALILMFVDPFLTVFVIFLYGFYIAHKIYDINYLTSLTFALIYGVFFVSTIGLLHEINKYLIFILFATVWAGDTTAYFVGKKFGKHKFAPRLSPKKTWEGAVGSFIGSIFFGGITAYYFHMYEAFIPIVIAAVLLQIGDLFESFLKRQVEAKDSSHLIPGHGGILDRIDALIFASMVFYIFYKVFII